MKEPIELVRAWRGLPAGTPLILATVVETKGSTYRRPGARMLLEPNGWIAGSISGGCLEGDLVQTAWERTQDGPALVTYDSTADEDIVWGFGLGCKGLVQVLIERLPSDGGVLADIARCLDERTPLEIRTCLSGPRLGEHRYASGTGRGGCRMVKEEDALWLVEQWTPPRSLVVFGAGHDAVPLVQAAKELGYHVSLVDHRESYARHQGFASADAVHVLPAARLGELDLEPGSAAVVMTHHFLTDLEILRVLLAASEVQYVGVLGPKRRTERLLFELGEQGAPIPAEALRRLYAPIGLDIGAEGPYEIALSILAEMQAVFAGRNASYLRDADGPLHDPADEIG